MNKYSKNKSIFMGPLLDTLKVHSPAQIDASTYPFSLNIIKNLQDIHFTTQVTFFIGENGTGKSTLLEAIANNAGFGAEGGSRNISFKTSAEHVYSGTQALADCLTLSWRLKPLNGYFFRAESFYNIANYLDAMQRECGGDAYGPYGGKSLHDQSHGEGFFSFFKNRMGPGGFFILDEPEAALSPQRQLSFLVILQQLCKDFNTQFIIATHSPILLAYPNATIYSCDDERLTQIDYIQTQHYQITKQFLNNPKLYIKKLFEDES
jgi:predicted ATPase